MKRRRKFEIVASRGPLNICTHMMTVPEFLVAVKIDPDNATSFCVSQQNLLKDGWKHSRSSDYVEGILMPVMILPDFVEADYMEFAHPYLKKY